MEREVSLFRNGSNQAVRIPKGMELPGETALLRKDGDRLIIEPKRSGDLLGLLRTFEPLSDDDAMPPISDDPAEDVKL